MYAMQYEISLPADYDMQIIRHRVATRGALLDNFPGLGLKAYLIRGRGNAGSAVNQYAPFYLWASIDGMNRFLWGGGGFRNIIESFGRPAVMHWTGVAFCPGPASQSVPRHATRSIETIADSADLEELAERERAQSREIAKHPNAHSSAFAIDPRHWQLLRFALWQDAVPAAAAGTHYEVLHLSRPHMNELFSRDGRAV